MKITTGGRERIHDTSILLQQAFKDDPVLLYLLQKLSDSQRHEYLYSYFVKLLTAAGMNHAVFEEVDDYSSATVIMPPGFKVDNPWTLIPAGLASLVIELGIRACYRMLFEFGSKTDAAKKRGLKGCKRYYYLFFIATSSECEGRGLGTAMLNHAQARAEREKLPLWLEATTERSMRLYEKNGFELVEVFIVGAGRADANGRPKQGGEGVRLWAMVWWPRTVVAVIDRS